MLKFTANLSLLFTELPLIDRFKAAKNCGFNAVEIQFPYTLSAMEIKHALEEHNLKLVLFNIDAGDLLDGGEGLACVPDRKTDFINALQQCKSYAEILQPECINVLPGRCIDKTKKSLYLKTLVENLRLTLDTLSPLGINTVFEAINTHDIPHFIIHSGQQMLELVNTIDHPMLAMQYDIYHMSKMGEDVLLFIQQHSSKMGHIQFADVPGRGQPTTGALNFKQLFKEIEQSTYQGWLGAEYIPSISTEQSLTWFNDYKTP